MKKKIYFIIPDLRCGGAEKVFINLANNWAKLHDISFILMNKKGEMLKDLHSQINIIDLKITKLRYFFPKLIRIFKKNNNAYFISAMWPLNTIVLLASLFSIKSNKIFITEHINLSKSIGVDFSVPKFLLKLSISFSYIFAKKIICVSEGVRRDLIKLSFLNLNNKIVTIYNPLVTKIPILKSKKNKKTFLLSVGTLKKQKNHKLILDCLKLIDNKDNYHLDIVGDGPLLDELKDYSIELGITKYVKFHGYKRNLENYYNKSDIVILSSIYGGFGNVLVEALSYGLKIISTDCEDGPKEILENGKFGLLIPTDNPLSMKKALMDIEDTSFNRLELQERSKKFEVDTISELYLKNMGIIK